MTSASVRGPVLLGPMIAKRPRRVALAGNPNVGKSSLFNALTGLRQKVTNYPGTTVEKVVGRMSAGGSTIDVVDLPGSYSLLARSPDEAVARDEILGRIAGDPPPDVVIVVVDASNLERNLFLATQILDTGRACVVAMNQADLALERGVTIDVGELSRRIGVPVIATNGRTGQGRDALAEAVAAGGKRPRPLELDLPAAARDEASALALLFASRFGGDDAARREIAWRLLSEAAAQEFEADLGRADVEPSAAQALAAFRSARARLAAAGVDVVAGAAVARYAAVGRIVSAVATPETVKATWRSRLDAFLLHRVFGFAALFGVFSFLFLVIFKFAAPVMGLAGDGVGAFGAWAGEAAGGGLFGDFVENGVVGGFGAFLVFVPQIALLFICIETLEDSGYLARAAFLLDRAMGKVGLPGRAFLPLLSGFACAIPGVMATRTMSNARDRLVTMAVLPLMSCSARLPVYFLVLAAVFSAFAWWVGLVVVVSMYLVGILVAVLAAGVLRRTILKGGRTPLLLELPPYRRPLLRTVARNVGRRTWTFVAGAGPIILALSMGLWALAAFPRAPAAAESAGASQLETSYIGRAGKLIEPAIKPLGFDWKMGIGILSSFAARETFVPTLGVIYGVEGADDAGEAAENETLLTKIRDDRWPDGRPVYTPLVGVSLLVFYVLALQCMSTLAVLKRETNGWRWPIGLFVALTVVAYLASLLTFQVGSALGF